MMRVTLELNNEEFRLQLSGKMSKDRLIEFINKHWTEGDTNSPL